MHIGVLAVGHPDPASILVGRDSPLGTIDWAGIGGRYTGQLTPVPGATTARVYGDTMPSIEAHIAALIGSEDGSPVMTRPGLSCGAGVDQAACRLASFRALRTSCQWRLLACLHDSQGFSPYL